MYQTDRIVIRGGGGFMESPRLGTLHPLDKGLETNYGWIKDQYERRRAGEHVGIGRRT
jgi:hypothetical protein